MKKLKDNVYWPIVFLLTIQLFVSSEAFWMLGLGLCIFQIIKNKDHFFIPFSEYKLLFIFIPWGLSIGFVGLSQGDINTRDIIRDIFYYMNPLIFLFVGATLAKKEINLFRILNAFIIASAVICFIQFTQVFGILGGGATASSVYGWRKLVGDGHIVTGVALAITMAKIIPYPYKIPKAVAFFSTLISVSYFVISISRTNILIVVILYAVLLFQKNNKKRIFSRVLGLLIGITAAMSLASHILPKDVAKAFSEKMSGSFSEINSTQSWSNIDEVQSNWRGYETFCAITQWEQEDALSRFLGSGFGTRIYVGKYAYSLLGQVDENGNAASSIAVLHNGYASQLIKLGLFGVIAYVLFYLLIIRKAFLHIKVNDSLEVRFLLGVGIVFLMQTYFLNGLFKDYVFLPTILLIGYSAYKIERKQDHTEQQ